MKWRESKRLIFFVISILCIVSSMMATIQHQISFSSESVTISQDTVNTIAFCNVRYDGLGNTGHVGYPSLPVKYLTFSVPYDAYDINIDVSCSSFTTFLLYTPIYPEQEQQPTNNIVIDELTLPDSTQYSKNEYYPANKAYIIDEGFFGGDNHVITIAVYPLQYNPILNKLILNNNIEIAITYQNGDGTTLLPIKPIDRYHNSGQAEKISVVKQLVANPTHVESFTAPTADMPLENDTTSYYEYCIITNRQLAPAFNRLSEWKKSKGYDAGIVCMEDILRNPLFQDGDMVSGINDDAGKLRAYLKRSYEIRMTKYVLLGGTQPNVPFRYGCGLNNNATYEYSIPSDLYFADINGNWNYDNDIYYGEISNDRVDSYPEMYIGRLLCKNQSEINNYIDRLLLYEINPGKGDFSYLEKSLFTYSCSMFERYAEDDTISSVISEVYDDYKTIYQNGNYPTGSQAITEFNNLYGYISLHGHGCPEGVQLTESTSQCVFTENETYYGLNALDSEHIYIANEANNGLDCLTNQLFPSVMYSIACSTMPFDEKKGYSISINFGGSFTTGGDYGGVAYLGNTRYGYMGLSTNFEKALLKQLNLGNANIGIAEANSKLLKNSGINNHFLKLSHNLLGDPEFMVWTQIPDVYSDVEISVNRMDNSIYVTGVNIGNCYVSAYTPEGNVYKYEMTNGSVNMEISPNSAIMIYRHNMLPYFPPLLVQNQTYEKSQYIFASSVQMGKFVDSERSSQGNVIFCNGVNFEINATDDVFIYDGFIVEAGASITIKTQGNVYLNGGLVKAGGRLSIESFESSINSSFIAESGAEIEISTNKKQ